MKDSCVMNHSSTNDWVAPNQKSDLENVIRSLKSLFLYYSGWIPIGKKYSVLLPARQPIVPAKPLTKKTLARNRLFPLDTPCQ